MGILGLVPLVLGPLTMAAWDFLHLICSWIKPHPFLRVAGDRGPHLALVYFLGLIAAGSHLTAEMEKVGDTGDISLLFFLAGANFWAILGNFWAILGHFSAIFWC